MTVNIRLGAASFAALALVCSSPAQEKPANTLIDARTAIRQILANDPEAKIENMESEFAARLRAFCDHSDEESPQTAAKQWLALVDEAIALPHRSFTGMLAGYLPGPVGTLTNVLIALPRPEAWPEIQALVKNRPPSLDRTVLLMLCSRLNGDNEGVHKLCDDYDRQSPPDRRNENNPSKTLGIRFAALSRLGKANLPEVLEAGLMDPWGPREDLPALTDILPLPVAKDLVLRVLKSPNGARKLDTDENRKLAEGVFLEHLKDFPIANWSLPRDKTDSQYIKKLVEHYGFQSLIAEDNHSDTAQEIYLRDLAIDGNLKLAAKLLNGIRDTLTLDVQDWASVKNPDEFVAKLQARVPHADLWPLYVNAAIASGHIPAAIGRLQRQVALASTSSEQRYKLRQYLFDLHSRQGDMKALTNDWEEALHARKSNKDFDPSEKMLEIGLATGDNQLVSRVLPHVPAGPLYWLPFTVFGALVQRGEFGQLEQLELRRLAPGDNGTQISRVAEDLCKLYFFANRPKDILELLRKFPDWPADDLGSLKEDVYSGYQSERVGEDDQPTAFYGAWALSKTGRNAEATRVLRNLVLRNCDLPRCYELLNQINGLSAIPIYDEVIHASPYAPIPVLWKGDLLLRLGKTAEAEACLRQAEKIDPVGRSSYGERFVGSPDSLSFGYREKLLDLTGQVLKAKGDLEGVKKCTVKSAAVKLASHASELKELGLITEGVEAMKRAVVLWPNDAVLQARLADYLELQCRPDEAKEHYEKAFQSVIASLGEASADDTVLYKPEFHDLGIEIMNKIISDEPNEAKAYYARGLIHLRAHESKDATSDFQRALAIDPGYVEALGGLATIAREGLLSPEEAQRIEFRSIDLGVELQQSRFLRSSLSIVTDLGKAYQLLKNKLRTFPTVDTTPLFPLRSAPEVGRFGSGIIPEFDALNTRGRLIGAYIQNVTDISEIVELYHTTNYPFD